MKYLVYKITNQINGKFYVGVHKTDNINDDYMGSGTILKRAQDKYGIENFTKEILAEFDNHEDMFNMEAKLVNEEFVSNQNTYNINCGGNGSFTHINERLKNDKDFRQKLNQKISEKQKKRFIEGKFDPYYLISFITENGFKGKTHTEDTKKQMSLSHKGKHDGSKNSQYGTCWIYNENIKESKKIKKEDLSFWLDNGWLKGRKLKF